MTPLQRMAAFHRPRRCSVVAARRLRGQAEWKQREIAVLADSIVGGSALESRSLGLRGLDDASVHRWRRSDAADAAAAQLGRLCQRGEPGSGDRGFHRRTGPCRLGFFGDDAGGDRPAYHPSTLLKIYLYGYLNRVQSSRRLEREAQRNIELMWLVGRLAPDFKTIADFRKDNGEAIQSVCRQFVELCRRLHLFTRAVVAIDGSKFKAVNNRDKNYTVAKVSGRMEQVDASIARYLRASGPGRPRRGRYRRGQVGPIEGEDCRPASTDAGLERDGADGSGRARPAGLADRPRRPAVLSLTAHSASLYR